MRIRHAVKQIPLICGALMFGCGNDNLPVSVGSEADCSAKEQAYSDFVAGHLACASDADCAVVGDCGPNADFTAVAASAADDAYQLAKARCSGSFDGPVYNARCIAGACMLEERTDTCCGCPSGDAGL